MLAAIRFVSGRVARPARRKRSRKVWNSSSHAVLELSIGGDGHDRKLFLEGDVVVGDAYVGVVGLAVAGRGALVVGGGAGFGVAATAGGAFAAGLAAEQGEFVDEDLGLVFLFAAGLVVPGAGLDLAFDEELGALLDVVANDLGGALEADQVVPLGLVGPVALGVLLAVRGGEREAGDGHAAGGGTDFGVFADVAEEENFVDAFCHVFGCSGSVFKG